MTGTDLASRVTDGQRWDVVVVGAGPAGSMAALHLARPDLKLLVVDRCVFPRHKVCGCCLNGLAIARLEEAGLKDLCRDLGGVRLQQVQLMAEGKIATLPLGPGYAVSRKAFDHALIQAAERRGATFLPATHAQLSDVQGDGCRLNLRHRNIGRQVWSRVVLCADGLGGSFLRPRQELAPRIDPRARIGLSTILNQPCEGIREGIIYMTVGRNGYAGLVRLEDGTVDVAAALDASALGGADSPASIIRGLFLEAGLSPVPDLGRAQWKGTPPLTRHRHVLGSDRILILGDAACYVEPFTGEGISWALSSGQLVAPFAQAAIERWDAGLIHAWERAYREHLGHRQRVCRLVSRGLRHPVLYRSVFRLLNWNPSLANSLVNGMNRERGMRVGL